MASINPLDCDPIPISLNYINGMYWVGMNTSWMVLVDSRGSWMLVEVFTLLACLLLLLHPQPWLLLLLFSMYNQ